MHLHMDYERLLTVHGCVVLFLNIQSGDCLQGSTPHNVAGGCLGCVLGPDLDLNPISILWAQNVIHAG